MSGASARRTQTRMAAKFSGNSGMLTTVARSTLRTKSAMGFCWSEMNDKIVRHQQSSGCLVGECPNRSRHMPTAPGLAERPTGSYRHEDTMFLEYLFGVASSRDKFRVSLTGAYALSAFKCGYGCHQPIERLFEFFARIRHAMLVSLTYRQSPHCH